MKQIIFLVILILSVTCEKNDTIQKFIDEIHANDTNCLNAIKRAENDLKNEKNIYCKSFGMLSNLVEERHTKEFDSILKSKNIEIKSAYYSDIVYENKRQNCYCELMNMVFEKKYGNNFIDSIHFISDSIWIRKNPDLIFSKTGLNGIWNKPALFPGDKFYDSEYHTGLQEKFDELYDKYDRNYLVTNKENGVAQIRIDIYVDRLGKSTVKDYYITYFDNHTNKENYNKSYHKSIKDLAFKLIKENKWKPATVGNINVNSEFSMIINLK